MKQINFKDKSLLTLIVVNIFPIIGVLFLKWNFLHVIFLYVIETVIIGLFNVAKIIISQKGVIKIKIKDIDFSDPNALGSKNTEEYPGCMKIVIIPFFLVHYNAFVLVQTVFFYFISTHLGEQEFNLQDFFNVDYILNILFIVGSHAYSFIQNYVKKEEYLKVSLSGLMIYPYKRVIIQQAAVIIGSFIIFFLKAPIIFMIVLIMLKMYFDIKAHNKIHNTFSESLNS